MACSGCGWKGAGPVKIVHSPSQLERRPRAVAIGSFDGVHRGHQKVLETAIASGLAATAITFDPHPRIALGNDVELITTLERRLELFAEAGIEATLVAGVHARADGARAGAFAERYLRAIGTEAVIAGGGLPLRPQAVGRPRAAAPARLRDPRGAAGAGRLVVGDPARPARGRRRHGREAPGASVRARRHRRRRQPARRHARLPDRQPRARAAPDRAPRTGSTPAAARGHRAALSIGTNPHYGGTERRIEPFLLDFDGDLYGQRLVVEVWQRLRDEAVFSSEEELVDADRA